MIFNVKRQNQDLGIKLDFGFWKDQTDPNTKFQTPRFTDFLP